MDPAFRMESPRLNLALVERALREDPNSFEFFTAVRLLARLQPERTHPGGDSQPADETVRFSVNPSLAFPASEIQTLAMPDDAPARMSVNFMGLTGPSGVLPYVYSHFVQERQLAKDHGFADFLDLFHHRILSLFYKGWEKHRFILRYERTRDDPVTRHLRDIEGLGLETERRIGDIGTEQMAGYAGLLGPEPRSATSLEQMLTDWFDVPVAVEQFLGGWYRVEATDQCALDEDGLSSSLGVGALVGDEVWDPQGRVRLRIGPLDRAQYEAFLPTGRWHEPLRTLVHMFGHDQFEFEVQLVLHSDDVPGLRLGRTEDTGERLGWSSWIRTKPRVEDGDETVLRL